VENVGGFPYILGKAKNLKKVRSLGPFPVCRCRVEFEAGERKGVAEASPFRKTADGNADRSLVYGIFPEKSSLLRTFEINPLGGNLLAKHANK